MPGVFKIKNLQDAEFTLTHHDGAGAISIDSNNIAKSDVVNAALALKANTDDLKELGVGQTWQNVTASRTSGVTYTNTTGKPIQLLISVMNNSNLNLTTYFWVDGVNVATNQFVFNGDVIDIASIIVPAGSNYKVTASTVLYVTKWFELR